jgi:4-methylaminobutanoate oxidase (formaldehyde-forming)
VGGRHEVVILGAGILGCALAWRLAARNIYRGESILVVDPNPAASQATSRAAALLSLARPSAKAHWIPLVQSTLRMAWELARAGCSVPLHRVGAIHLAGSDYALKVLDDHGSAAARYGLSCERVAPQDYADRLPWLDMSRFAEALWFPDERYTDPYLLGSAYAAAARALGVRFQFGKPASLVANGNRIEVEFDEQLLAPGSVWVAAGAWSNVLLRPLGTCAGQAAVRSHYWITERTPLASRTMPMVSAADLRLYARPELGAVLFGLRETQGLALRSTKIPKDLDGFAFATDDAAGHATLEAFAELLEKYAPDLLRTGLRHYISGPSCYTPDGDFLVGSVAGWDNLKLLSGCNGAGIAVSGGLADVAADCERGVEHAAQAFRPSRFAPTDADAPAFIASCIAARSSKTSG